MRGVYGISVIKEWIDQREFYSAETYSAGRMKMSMKGPSLAIPDPFMMLL